MGKIFPKSEEDLIWEEIYQLTDDPKNYSKLSHLYHRLLNVHGVAIGKTSDDNYHFILAKICNNNYIYYRNLWYNEMRKEANLIRINKLKLYEK
jgi:hypothetical protein